jgi:hypothetical protein
VIPEVNTSAADCRAGAGVTQQGVHVLSWTLRLKPSERSVADIYADIRSRTPAPPAAIGISGPAHQPPH